MKLILDEKQTIFQPRSAGFLSCHASTLLRLEEGKALCAYFAGEKEGSDDQAIWLSRSFNGKWIAPERLFYFPGTKVWNPVLHRDANRILMYFKKGDSVIVWITMVSESTDDGATWSEPCEAVPGDRLPRSTTRNAICVCHDGTWLAPNSVENGKTWDAYVDMSTDRGKTWTMRLIPLSHVPDEKKTAQAPLWKGLSKEVLWMNDANVICKWDGIIQPTIWLDDDGKTCHALMRSTRGYVYQSDSADGGYHWCEAYATSLPNNNSAIDAAKISQDHVAMVCNPVSGNWAARSPLSLLLSEDNAKNFRKELDLETDDAEFSYPCIRRYGDELHICYTSRRESIVYAKVIIEGRK